MSPGTKRKGRGRRQGQGFETQMRFEPKGTFLFYFDYTNVYLQINKLRVRAPPPPL